MQMKMSWGIVVGRKIENNVNSEFSVRIYVDLYIRADTFQFEYWTPKLKGEKTNKNLDYFLSIFALINNTVRSVTKITDRVSNFSTPFGAGPVLNFFTGSDSCRTKFFLSILGIFLLIL